MPTGRAVALLVPIAALVFAAGFVAVALLAGL
jgi:hypothetical protein